MVGRSLSQELLSNYVSITDSNRKMQEAKAASSADGYVRATTSKNVVVSGDNLRSGMNWLGNTTTVTQIFFEWNLGLGPAERIFVDDRVANAFRNAWKVNEAREFFYNKYAGVTDLTGASVTDYQGKFGLGGLVRAGIDPIEQFVGSYGISIHAVEGDMLQFTLTNTTSMQSLLYGIGPHWERSSFEFWGNTRQTYIFTEPVRLKW